MFSVFQNQLRSTLLSIRFLIGVLLGLSVVMLNGISLLEFSKWLAEPLSVMDIYIYSSADRFAVFLCFLGAIVVLSNVSVITQNEVYILLRVSRKKWVGGKLLYIITICFLYHFCIVLITMFYAAPDSYWGNFWSNPLYIMAVVDYQTAYDWGLSFPYSNVLANFSPAGATLMSLLLNSLYVASLGIILFFVSLKLNRVTSFAVVMLLHMVGYILLRIRNGYFFKYSLLGNSILVHHSFSKQFFSEKLPHLISSLTLFGAVILIFSILIYRAIKFYDFRIST